LIIKEQLRFLTKIPLFLRLSAKPRFIRV